MGTGLQDPRNWITLDRNLLKTLMELPEGALKIYIYLRNLDQGRWFSAAIPKIKAMVGCETRCVSRNLKLLRDKELIHCQGGANGQPYLYRFPAVEVKPQAEAAQVITTPEPAGSEESEKAEAIDLSLPAPPVPFREQVREQVAVCRRPADDPIQVILAWISMAAAKQGLPAAQAGTEELLAAKPPPLQSMLAERRNPLQDKLQPRPEIRQWVCLLASATKRPTSNGIVPSWWEWEPCLSGQGPSLWAAWSPGPVTQGNPNPGAAGSKPGRRRALHMRKKRPRRVAEPGISTQTQRIATHPTGPNQSAMFSASTPPLATPAGHFTTVPTAGSSTVSSSRPKKPRTTCRGWSLCWRRSRRFSLDRQPGRVLL